MFNTFGSESIEFPLTKNNRILLKQRVVDLNNLSAIQLNPWNDDNIKSPLYFEGQGLPSFPKPCLNNPNAIKYSIPKQIVKRQNVKITLDCKKMETKKNQKKKSYLSRDRNRVASDYTDLERMNKTISVHNIEGDRMLERHESIQRKQKILQKQQKRHRTTISNPMYGKFCNNYNTDKQNILQRKTKLNDLEAVKIDSFSIKDINYFKTRMSTFSMERGDPERARSIHEVRKRLKSTSSVMKRIQENNETRANQQTLSAGRQLFGEHNEQKSSNQTLEYINLGSELCSSVKVQAIPPSSSSQKFMLGRRKNLYIGFRKFFNPSLNKRQKSLHRKQSQTQQIINLDALIQRGQINVLKHNQTLQQHTYQKFINKNY